MKSLRTMLAATFAFGITSTLWAQGGTSAGTRPATGSHAAVQGGQQATGEASTTNSLDQAVAQLFEDGGLAAVLSDADVARALGLDLEQWMQAQFIIEEYQSLVALLMQMDPEGQEFSTMQMLAMGRFFVDFQLYFLLTPDQQQLLNQLLFGVSTETSAAGCPPPGSGDAGQGPAAVCGEGALGN